LPSEKPIPTELNNESNNERLTWSAEVIEALVECIYIVWKDRRAADNGFKTEVWLEALDAVMRIYKGPRLVGSNKCKNK
jgi:hypothetical protein